MGEVRFTVIIKHVAVGIDKNQYKGIALVTSGFLLPFFSSLSLFLVIALEASVVAQEGLVTGQDLVQGVILAVSGQLFNSGVDFSIIQHLGSLPLPVAACGWRVWRGGGEQYTKGKGKGGKGKKNPKNKEATAKSAVKSLPRDLSSLSWGCGTSWFTLNFNLDSGLHSPPLSRSLEGLGRFVAASFACLEVVENWIETMRWMKPNFECRWAGQRQGQRQ
jgi:hypothetical protein